MSEIEPITREELLLNSIAGEGSSEIEPITRQEHYLSAIAGESDLPASIQPITREEIYYQKILDNGGGGGGGDEPTGTKNISITENGVTTHNIKAYATAQITANVPNSYSASDEGKVVDNGDLVSQTSKNITANGTYDTTLNDEVVVSVSGGGSTNLWTPVNSLIVHDGNAFDFEITVDPSKHYIAIWASAYNTASANSPSFYNSYTGGNYRNSFFAIAGRNGGYNRWNFNGYSEDNVPTTNSKYFLGSLLGIYTSKQMTFSKEMYGDGSVGTTSETYPAKPQTETLIHIGESWDGKEFYRFGIKDFDSGQWLFMWTPALDGNGTPCFYDAVNKKLIYNVGTGTVGYTINGVEYGV